MLSAKQNTYYWRLWGQVHKARPELDRKDLHVELGLPESHQMFGQKEMDRWIAGCQAILKPDDMEAQIRQERMPLTRLLISISNLLSALEKPEEYAVGIVRQMNAAGRIGQPLSEDRAYVRDDQGRQVFFDYAHTVEGEPARQGLTLSDLDELELHKVVVALKKDCKRRWPTKEKLLGELATVLNRPDLDRATARDAVCAALNVDRVPDPERSEYEAIVVMLGAMRTACEPLPGERIAEGIHS